MNLSLSELAISVLTKRVQNSLSENHMEFAFFFFHKSQGGYWLSSLIQLNLVCREKGTKKTIVFCLGHPDQPANTGQSIMPSDSNT